MFKPFYAFIGTRYAYVKRKNHFISFISLSSVLGVALGVGVLIAVLSVMNGFNREIRVQMLSGTPHITIGKIGGFLNNWSELKQKVQTLPDVEGAAPFIFGQAMLSKPAHSYTQGVMVKGIDPQLISEVYPLKKKVIQGELNELAAGEFGVLLGRTTAEHFQVRVGDKISLIAPEASVTPVGIMPRIKQFTVVGVFEMGDLYDDKQIFINLEDASKLFRTQGAVSGLQLKVWEELQAPQIAQRIKASIGPEYWVVDWTYDFGNFFNALQIQKTVMSFILFLIIAVAAFNLVSSLVMMVTDKRADIAILRTLGASKLSIMGIFMTQGVIVGIVGTALGSGLGLFLATHVTQWVEKLQQFFQVDLVSKEVYLIGFLPSEIHVEDVLVIVATALIMCFMATLYPAFRAAAIQPAEALRYE